MHLAHRVALALTSAALVAARSGSLRAQEVDGAGSGLLRTSPRAGL